MEAYTSNSVKESAESYLDDDGFMRKKSNNMGLLLWLGVIVANLEIDRLPDDLALLALLSWPISAYLVLIAIQMVSTHDINTWRGTPHVKLWIFLGSMIAGLLGVIAYFLLKRREKGYLKKAMSSAKRS